MHTSYASTVLPSLLIDGFGLGLVIAPSINTGTYGVDIADAGVASASVNTGQQLGGSIGTSLLNTIAAGATAAYLTAARQPAHPGPRPAQPGAHRPGSHSWLHNGLLVGGCHLRLRGRGGRPAVPVGPAGQATGPGRRARPG